MDKRRNVAFTQTAGDHWITCSSASVVQRRGRDSVNSTLLRVDQPPPWLLYRWRRRLWCRSAAHLSPSGCGCCLLRPLMNVQSVLEKRSANADSSRPVHRCASTVSIIRVATRPREGEKSPATGRDIEIMMNCRRGHWHSLQRLHYLNAKSNPDSIS